MHGRLQATHDVQHDLRRGLLRRVDGQEEARQAPGITGLKISARLNSPIVPLPEGSAYLGFIFAQGTSPVAVETSLRDAHKHLKIKIDTIIPLLELR